MGGIVSRSERRGSSEDEGIIKGTGSIRRVHPADRVTVDAFRPIVSLGASHLGPVCLAERKSDARFFTIRHTLKYIALRDDLMDSILNEMQIWLCLEHPFIAKIRYTFQNDYYLYLVQDYMEGGNMQSLSMERKWSEVSAGFSICLTFPTQPILARTCSHYIRGSISDTISTSNGSRSQRCAAEEYSFGLSGPCLFDRVWPGSCDAKG